MPVLNLHVDISFAFKWFEDINLCWLHNAIWYKDLKRAFPPGTGVFTEARLCRNTSKVSDSTQVQAFFSLENRFCPYRVPVGVDLVLHWLDYTSCGSGGGFVGLCQESPEFCSNGHHKECPKTFTYSWSSWSCSLPEIKYCIMWTGTATSYGNSYTWFYPMEL